MFLTKITANNNFDSKSIFISFLRHKFVKANSNMQSNFKLFFKKKAKLN